MISSLRQAAALATAGLAMAGCSAGVVSTTPAGSPPATLAQTGTPTPARSGGAAAQLSPTSISAAGLNATYDCGDQAVTVSGADDTIHFVGTCPTIAATGTANTITVDTVGEIQATGTGNRVVWHAGLNGRPPQIVNGGIDNTVRQG